MMQIILAIQEQVRREFGFHPLQRLYFYRDHQWTGRCGCRRYFELLDACPLRIPSK